MLKLLILLILNINLVYAAQVKIGIIDTGLDLTKLGNIKLCSKGHYDFETNKKGIGRDFNGHGTNIALTIVENLGTIDYCLVIYKYNIKDVSTVYKAVDKAIINKVDLLNISLSGKKFITKEYFVISKASDLGIKVVVSAGNDSKNLTTKTCDVYPACYTNIKNLIVVGNLKNNNTLHEKSNYGIIVHTYEIGKSCFYNVCWEGTSQATAIYTGKLAKTIFNIKLAPKANNETNRQTKK